MGTGDLEKSRRGKGKVDSQAKVDRVLDQHFIATAEE